MRQERMGLSLLAIAMLCGVETTWAEAQTVGSDVAPASPDSPWSRGVPPGRRHEARALYEAGNRELRELRFARAAAAYEDALARWDHPGIHYNLAIAYINLGRPVDAYESVRMALRFGGAALHPGERAQALSYLRLLRGQIAELALASAVPGAVVRLDGEAVLAGAGRAARRLAPGAYHLVVSKPGYRTETGAHELEPGSRVTLAIALRRPLVGPEATRDMILGGLVLGAAGAALHAMARDELAAFDARQRQRCPAGCRDDDPASPVAMLRRARWKQRVAVAAYVAGGSLLSAGLTALFMSGDRRLDITTTTTDLQVTLAPAGRGAVAGFAVVARF